MAAKMPVWRLMTDPESQNSAKDAPAFPYQVLWAGYGNAEVTLRELETNADEYRILNETTAIAKPGTPFIERSEVARLLVDHGLPDECADRFWLVCCFYLAPAQAEAFGIDPGQSRQVLIRIASAASHLDRALDSLPPKVAAAMYFKRPLVEEVEDPQGPDFFALQPEVRDLARVAAEAAEELRNTEGRPRNHHRDTMLRLLLELMAEQGLDDLKISEGTRTRPEAHLTGQAGQLLMALVGLVEPNWQEEWLTPKLKPILRDFRRRHAR